MCYEETTLCIKCICDFRLFTINNVQETNDKKKICNIFWFISVCLQKIIIIYCRQTFSTAFYVLGLIASTPRGADILLEFGWEAVRHRRTDRFDYYLQFWYKINGLISQNNRLI